MKAAKGKDIKKLSSVEPKFYAQRFVDFMTASVIIDMSAQGQDRQVQYKNLNSSLQNLEDLIKETKKKKEK